MFGDGNGGRSEGESESERWVGIGDALKGCHCDTGKCLRNNTKKNKKCTLYYSCHVDCSRHRESTLHISS